MNIILFIIVVIPWVIWIVLAFYTQGLKKQLKAESLRNNELKTDLKEKLEIIDIQKELIEKNKQVAFKAKKETDQILGKKKFNPAELSYQELEACMNYFVENQHKLKSQSK